MWGILFTRRKRTPGEAIVMERWGDFVVAHWEPGAPTSNCGSTTYQMCDVEHVNKPLQTPVSLSVKLG